MGAPFGLTPRKRRSGATGAPAQLRTLAFKFGDGRLAARYSMSLSSLVPVEPRFGREFRRGDFVDAMFTMQATKNQPFNLG